MRETNMGKLKTNKARYSADEDAVIRRLYVKGWSKFEIVYRLHAECQSTRTILGVSQRISVLLQDGKLKAIQRGKRYATQEALDWVNKTYSLKEKPSKSLDLREHKTGTKAKGKAKGSTTKKSTVREVLGFSRVKEPNEPNPSYMVKAVKMSQMSGNPLGMFRDLLESGIAEGKTAPDILDDLRLVGT